MIKNTPHENPEYPLLEQAFSKVSVCDVLLRNLLPNPFFFFLHILLFTSTHTQEIVNAVNEGKRQAESRGKMCELSNVMVGFKKV